MPDDKISELPLVPSGTPLKATDEAVVNFRNPDDSFTTMRDTFAKMKAFFSGDKENVGIAASLLSSHVAQSNPHSQYALFGDLEYLENLHNYVTYGGSVATIGGNFDTPHKTTFALTADCVFQGEGRKVNGVMNGSLAAKAGQFVTVARAADDTTNSYVWAVDSVPNYIDILSDKISKYADNSNAGNNFVIAGFTDLPYMFLISFSTQYAGYRPTGASTLTIAGQTLPLNRQDGTALQSGDVGGGLYVCLRNFYPDTYRLVGVGISGGSGSGNSITITAGEALVARNLVYLDTDGKYRKADYLIQSRIASEILIVEDATIANEATGTATLRGIVTGFTGLTVGSNYYVGENGAIVSEANLPDIDGMFQKYIGEAISATTLNFNPSSHYYEIEVTGVVDGLATVRTLVDQHWFVVDGKPNVDGTGTLTNGSEVRSIISKTDGLGGNRAVYQDLTEPAITQQIPTRPNGGVPTYINNEGGFLHIANGLDIQYRFLNDLGDIDATGEFWYVCRLHSGKRYEAIVSGFKGDELKRYNTGQMQFNYQDFPSNPNHIFNYEPNEFETIIFHFINNKTAGTCNIRVTDSVGDYRDLTTASIPTTSVLRNFGVGTSSHPASHDFFAYLFKFGSEFNTTDRATILSNLKATYPIGQLPSKSFARPTMGYNSGTTTFTITPNYVLRGGATSINNASTVVRWYMLKNNVSTGTYPNDALANITLIATTTGNQLSLNISSYPQFVVGGAGVGDEIVGAITVYDNLGAAFEIECATDPIRTI